MNERDYPLGPACVCGCGRPAREIGSYATPCWMALAPFERELLQWEHVALRAVSDTEPIDTVAVSLCAELEALFDLPDAVPEPTQHGEQDIGEQAA